MNLSPSTPSNEAPRTDPSTSASALWLWPVPILNGHRPVVSDGYGSKRGSTLHAGVDLMFLRNTPRVGATGPVGTHQRRIVGSPR